MYVGPWQEYKLMKVIEDLREEQDRLRQAVMTARSDDVRESAGGKAEDESSAALAATAPHSSSSSITQVQGQRWRPQAAAPQDAFLLPPFRRIAATDASSAYVQPDEFDSEDNDMENMKRNIGRYYPPGHPFARGRLHDITPQGTPSALQTSGQTTSALCQVQPVLSQPCTCTLPGHAEAEAALLARLAQSQTAAATAAQHPALNDLLRRPPLDTAAVGQRAGQKCYERRVKLGAFSGRTMGSEDLLSDVSSRVRKGQTSKRDEDTAMAELRARVERRLRLQALYSGVPMTEGEEQGQEERKEDNGDASQPGAGVASSSTFVSQAVGVPWDDLTRGPLCPAIITTTTSSALPTTTVHEQSEANAVQRMPKVVVLAPEDDVDDVGALLNWAEQLDSEAIDTM